MKEKKLAGNLTPPRPKKGAARLELEVEEWFLLERIIIIKKKNKQTNKQKNWNRNFLCP